MARALFGKAGRHAGRSAWGAIGIFLVLALAGVFMMLPLYYTVISSFKPMDELFAFPPRFYVVRPTGGNYTLLFKLVSEMWVPFSRYAFNSIFVAVVGTLANVMTSSMAAYPFALYRLKLRWIFNVVVLALLFNGTVLAYPQYVVMTKLGLLNNYLTYILPQLGVPLGFFLMKQFMEQIPISLVESAKIDGANQFRIFFRIVMPQVKPAWLTLSLFAFQTAWNQTEGNKIFDEQLKLMNLAVQQVMNGGTARYGVAMAGAVVLLIPPIVFFLVTQSGVIQTMSHSGIK